MKMKKITLLVVSLVALGLSGCTAGENKPRQDVDSSAMVQSTPPDAASQAALPVAALDSVATYVCQSGDASCQASVFGAKDDAEANWLKSHGYPSEAEHKRLSALSADQLKRAADAGSLPAMVMYGESASVSGDTKVGLNYIYSAIQNGSIYGYYGMSEAYAKSPGISDRIDAAAYLRVAYLLGDSRAGTEIQKNFAALSALELASIDRRASELYRSFAKSQPAVPRP